MNMSTIPILRQLNASLQETIRPPTGPVPCLLSSGHGTFHALIRNHPQSLTSSSPQSIDWGQHVKAPEGLEELLPTLHGQSAQILAYVAAKGTATPEEIRKDLAIPKSTVYKLLSDLFRTGLAIKETEGKVEGVRVPNFEFWIKNIANIVELKVTPRNLLAFDAAHTPAGRMFSERHGPEKFANFVELYDGYESGRTTAQLMARELGVIRYEIELLLSDIKSITPRAIQIGRSRPRQ
jgi:DNA-binding transcriptional ArsR family regulator